MMSRGMVPNAEFCVRLTLTLLHFLWQGAAIAFVAMAAAAVLRRRGSALRYWVFVAALGAMALCPPATFLALVPRGGSVQTGNVPQRPRPFVVGNAELAEMSSARAMSAGPIAPTEGVLTRKAIPLVRLLAQKERLLGLVSADTCRRAAPWVTMGYLAGVLAMLARLLLALGGGRGLRGRSQPVADSVLLATLERAAKAVRLRAAPAVAWCGRVAVPTVVGILKPTILLPLSLSSGLSAEQVEMLLLHELAHLRRHDQWVNLVQWVIETTLFFHPAVWVVSRRIRAERELACDAMVVAAGVGPTPYAESLLRMAELSRRAFAAEQFSALALGSHGQRFSGFGQRVLRLIEGQEAIESIRPRQVWPLAAALLLCLVMTFSFALRSGAQEIGVEKPGSASVLFSSGVRAEVLGVAVNPRQGEQCWSASGEPLASVPDGHETVGSRTYPGDKQFAREIYVRMTNLPASGDVSVTHKSVSGSGGGSSLTQTREKVEMNITGTFPLATKTATIALGVAAGPWETLTTSGPTGTGTSMDRKGKQIGLSISRTFREGGKVFVVVTHSGLEDNARLLGFDEQGRQFVFGAKSTTGAGPSSQSTYVCEVPESTKIKSLELQTRPYEWREIGGIALKPRSPQRSKIPQQTPAGQKNSDDSLAPFYSLYRLDDGEVLRRIAPPFIPERAEWHRQHGSGRRGDDQPDALGFAWNGKLEERQGLFGSSGVSLSFVLEGCGLAGYEIDGLGDLRGLIVPGDWVVREGTPREALLNALTGILKKDLGRDIRFEKRQVERDVLVVRGQYHFSTIPGNSVDPTWIQVYVDTLDPDEGAFGNGPLDSLLSTIVDLRVVNETGTPRPEIRYRCSKDMHSPKDPDDPARIRKILDHLSQQTGLTFTVENRPADVWFVSDANPSVGLPAAGGPTVGLPAAPGGNDLAVARRDDVPVPSAAVPEATGKIAFSIQFIENESKASSDGLAPDAAYRWRIATTATLQVTYRGIYLREDGTMDGNWGGGVNRAGDEGPVDLVVRPHIEDGNLVMRIERKAQSATVADISKTPVPEGTSFESRWRREPFAMDGRRYVSLWEGRFVRDGKTVETVAFVAAAAPMGDAGFEQAVDLHGRSKDLPVVWLAASGNARAPQGSASALAKESGGHGLMPAAIRSTDSAVELESVRCVPVKGKKWAVLMSATNRTSQTQYLGVDVYADLSAFFGGAAFRKEIFTMAPGFAGELRREFELVPEPFSMSRPNDVHIQVVRTKDTRYDEQNGQTFLPHDAEKIFETRLTLPTKDGKEPLAASVLASPLPTTSTAKAVAPGK